MTPTAPRLPGCAPSAAKISSGFGGAEGRRAERADKLGLIQLVVAAQQDQHGLAVRDIDERLDLALRRRRCRAACSAPRW